MRRAIAALFALFFLVSAAFAESYAFRFAGGATVVDENGTVIIAPGAYERVQVLTRDDGSVSGYAVAKDVDGTSRYAILLPDGKRITDFRYESIEAAGDSFLCGIGGAYRIVSEAGNEGTDSYSAIAYAGNGAYLTLSGNIYDEIADPLTLLDANGLKWQLGISALYGLGSFSDDLMPLCDGESVLFGYIGRNGMWQIPAQYEYAADFGDGYALVSTRAGYGVIDSSGEAVVDASQDFAERDGNSIMTLKSGTVALYEVESGVLSLLFESEIGDASPHLSGSSVILYADDGVTALGATGQTLFSASPTASINEAGGRYVVRDGEWTAESTYLTDADGIPLTAKYNTIRLLDGEGESAVYAYGIMADKTGDMMFGMLRGDGSIVSEPKYIELARVAPGLFCAVTLDGAQLIDRAGNTIGDLSD